VIPKNIARALLEAGLEWKPGLGDQISCFDVKSRFQTCTVTNILPISVEVSFILGEKRILKTVEKAICLWLPRLDQLLSEIRRYGWDWMMYEDDKCVKVNLYQHGKQHKLCFDGNNLEKSVAHALLWVLKREACVDKLEKEKTALKAAK